MVKPDSQVVRGIMGKKEIKIFSEDREAVLKALREGEVDHLELCTMTAMDEVVLFAHQTGFLSKLKEDFPDGREKKKTPLNLMLGLVFISKMYGNHTYYRLPYLLHSAAALRALGINVKLAEEDPFSQDGVRKFFKNKTKEDELINWANKLLPYYASGNTTGVYFVDTTPIEVPIDNENYEDSGVATKEGEDPKRGYKLLTLEAEVDKGPKLYQIMRCDFGPLNRHDLKLGRKRILNYPWQGGELLVYDRAFIDAQLINELNGEKSVDVLFWLKKNMDAFKDGISLAQLEEKKGGWKQSPFKEDEEYIKVEQVGWIWSDLEVRLDGWVIKKETEEGVEYQVLVTTRTDISFKEAVRLYRKRWDSCEEDYKQLKGDWGLEELHWTDKTLILISVIFILLAYNVFRVFYDGKTIGGKARQRIKQERIKAKKEAWVTVYHEDKFGLFPLQKYTFEILDRPPDIKEKLKKRMEELMDRK